MALDAATTKRFRALHKRGLTRNGIARELGVSTSTVTNWARKLGLTFDRSETAAAVQAHQIDLKARRARILDRIYSRIEAQQDRLEADGYTYTLIVPGGMAGASVERQTDPAPPSADERNHMQVITGYLTTAAKIEQIDADGGATEAGSMLAKLGAALGIPQP